MAGTTNSPNSSAATGDHTNAQSNQSQPGETLDAEEFSELEEAKVSETEGRGREPLRDGATTNDPQRRPAAR